MSQTQLSITGMSCQNCVRHAKEALESVSGVSSATVELTPGSAIVEHEGSDVQELISALREEGYEATVI